MGFRETGETIQIRGHTYFTCCCDKCGSLKQVRKDRLNSNLKCNAIRHTRPDVCSMLDDSENEFDYSIQSGKKAKWKCKICGNIFVRAVKDVVNRGINCPQCSDGISFPNKFMYSLLKSAKIIFEREKSFSWSDLKRYDFYIPEYSAIIEMNGMQHYEGCNYYISYEDIHKNDIQKKSMAVKNGINNYITIDSRISDVLYIKNSVLASDLKNIINFNEIDFKLVVSKINSNLFECVTKLWNEGYTTKEIASKEQISTDTVIVLLKRSAFIGLCEYDAAKQSNKWFKVSRNTNKKKIICLNDCNSFDSINDAAIYYNVSPKALSNCICRRSKSCGKEKNTNNKLYWKIMEE